MLKKKVEVLEVAAKQAVEEGEITTDDTIQEIAEDVIDEVSELEEVSFEDKVDALQEVLKNTTNDDIFKKTINEIFDIIVTEIKKK